MTESTYDGLSLLTFQQVGEDQNYLGPKKITMKFVMGQVLASSISNFFGIVIGHPFDTIKVRELLPLYSSFYRSAFKCPLGNTL